MCRNIRPLFNLDPPTDASEIHDAALQYVRKISGSTRPSAANAAAVQAAVTEVAAASQRLLDALVTAAPARDRAVLAARARERSAARYATALDR